MANEISYKSEQVENYVAELRRIAEKWKQIRKDIDAANGILNENVEANIQFAFNEVIMNNQKAFDCLEETLNSLGTTIEEAVEDIKSVDNAAANKIREKYGLK